MSDDRVPGSAASDLVIHVADAATGAIIVFTLNWTKSRLSGIFLGRGRPPDLDEVRQAARMAIEEMYHFHLPHGVHPSAETVGRRTWSVSFDYSGWVYTAWRSSESEADVTVARTKIIDQQRSRSL